MKENDPPSTDDLSHIEDFTTLSQAMNALRNKGYVENCSLKDDHLECAGRDFKLLAEDFDVDRYYRFEGMSNPSDNSILYAIRSEKYGIKGQLVNGYGIYSDDTKDGIIEKLKLH